MVAGFSPLRVAPAGAGAMPEPALTEGAGVPGLDSSTAHLVARYRTLRGR